MSARMKSATWLLLATVLAVGFGCARPDWIEQTLVTVDVSGVWKGSISKSPGSAGIEFTLQQSGSKVSGQLKIPVVQHQGGPIEGTVSGDIFRFRSDRGQMAGELQVNGDEMTGSVLGFGGRALIQLHREP